MGKGKKIGIKGDTVTEIDLQILENALIHITLSYMGRSFVS